MASTNKTTNYELSQYVGSDKPTYLTDYNQDMSRIDAGIHAAKSEADTNASSIGTLSSLTTEAKTSLVAAINEVESETNTNTGNIATNTSNIATNSTHIGTVANLTTTAKTDLVVAANEINAKVGNLTDLETTAKTSAVAAINEINERNDFTVFKHYTDPSASDITKSNCSVRSIDMYVARNAEGSVFKVYGTINCNTTGEGAYISLKVTGVSTASDFNIQCAGVKAECSNNSQNDINALYGANLSVLTNGTIRCTDLGSSGKYLKLIYHPCVYYAKDFGDNQ